MPTQQSHGKTSFLIMSDTHNLETAKINPDDCPLAKTLPKVDVLLHCGDLTQVGGLSAYKKALRLISSYDAKVHKYPQTPALASRHLPALLQLKLVIAGNHDISLDGEYWRTHLDEDDEPRSTTRPPPS